MKTLTLDVETTIKNVGVGAGGTFGASPFHTHNRIVMIGYQLDDEPIETLEGDETPKFYNIFLDHSIELLIGANITFDLHYIRKDFLYIWDHILENNVQVWDILYAEYLLSAQSLKRVSLDKCAQLNGGTLKDSLVSDSFKKGIGADDIHPEILRPYLEQDIKNTRLVYQKQVELAKKMGILSFIQGQMKAILPFADMEWNGIKVDNERLMRAIKDFKQQVESLESKLKDIMRKRIPDTDIDVNPNSVQHVAAILYGGVIRYQKREVVLGIDGEPIRYKTGKKKGEIKERWEDKECTVSPWLKGKWLKGKKKTDKATLAKLLREASLPKTLRKFLLLKKELNTTKKLYTSFFLPTKEYQWEGDLIHPKFNHTTTVTGRKSSSQPNFQNIPRS